jgi:S-adenosylmethionine synthetase
MSTYLFSSESVSEGHPDKLADRISDTILDAFLTEDPYARVAAETLVADGLVVLAGEFGSEQAGLAEAMKARAPDLAREVLRGAGYRADFPGIDPDSCDVRLAWNGQSENIHRGVFRSDGALGAGDQGLVFGYATDETPELMPLPLLLAHRLLLRHARLRKEGRLPWLRPDAKSQVTVRYTDGEPAAVHTVLLSTQHDPDVAPAEIEEAVRERIVAPVLSEAGWEGEPRVRVNPAGRFEVGGPAGDVGLTGRKIIVDTYGGAAPHGGGAFSGKDPTKVDRSAAYAARRVAKRLVARGAARRCTLQVAYAIGVPEPVSVRVDFHGTGSVDEEEVARELEGSLDLTPRAIIEDLRLRRPIYAATSVYGHFGREGEGFPWEEVGS